MNTIAWLIIACEVGFWIVIIAGLFIRYFLKKKTLGLIFLAMTPIIDILLLVATTIDLMRGATATSIHGIAAIYIGISIAYGKSMIAWADQKFKFHIMKDGTKPLKKYGYDHAKQEAKGAFRHVLAFIIGATFLFIMIKVINEPSKTNALLDILKLWALVLAVDFIYSISYFIWPRKQ